MDQEQINKLAALLGESPERIQAALQALDEEEHLYYNPNTFRRLHRINCEGLRSLVVPNLDQLRR